MRPPKRSKTPATNNCRLVHEVMVHTQMCQNAVKDVKQLMKRPRMQTDGPSSSNVKAKKLPLPTNTRIGLAASPLNKQKEGSQQQNPSFQLQNGLQYHLKVHMTEPNNILDRLCRIGEEVHEFLRLSENFIKSHKKTKRISSLMVDGQQDHILCHRDMRLNEQAERPNVLQCIERHKEKLDHERSVELKDCTSVGMDNCKEYAKHEEPVEECSERVEECSESDSEDDGYKELWCEAEFYRKCLLQDQRVQQNEFSTAKEECRHKFFLKPDVGLVCDACGLVGKDIETIFNFTWGNESRSQEQKKRSESTKDGALEATIHADSRKEQPADDDEQMHQSLILHSHYRAEMHEHQFDGFKFLERNIVEGNHGGCILAHAPGTGKTFLTIAFLHSFLQAYPDNRALILAPKSMLLPWLQEFRKWKVDLPLLNLYESSCSLQPTMDLSDYGIAMTDNNATNQLKLNHFKRVKEWQMTKSILLVSYKHFSYLVNHQSGDALTMEVRRLLLEVPGLLVMDEGHISRNSDTLILKCLTDIHTKKRILLSGTLFQNNFEEMYTLFKLVRPNFMREKSESLKGFLKTLFAGQDDRMQSKLFDIKLNAKKHPEDITEQRIFVNCLCEKIESGSAEEQDDAFKLLHELMAPFVHWHKGKVLEGLPGLTDFTIFLNLTPAQQEAFATLKSRCLNTMEKEKRSALANVHPLLLNMKHSKQASQTNEDFESNVEKMDQNADAIDGTSLSMITECDPTQGSKVMFVLDMVALCRELDEKVLIFSQNLMPLTLLQKLFWKLWGWYDNQQVFRLDGDISSESREHIINRFNETKASRVLLASIKTCGEGVSLVGASRVVFLDLNWNPAVTQQAISRAFRLGQSKRVYAYRLVGTGTLDEEIERSASKKEWLAAMISHASCSNSIFESGIGYEVDPEAEDRLFESAELRRQVAKCYRKTQDTIAL